MADGPKYVVVPDPDNPNRWRVRNNASHNLVGLSFGRRSNADRAAERRNIRDQETAGR